MFNYSNMIIKLCPNGVKYQPIDSVADLYYGKGNNIPKDGGEYPVYGCSGIVSSTSNFNNENTPIVGHIGSAGKVTWGEGKHFVTYNGTICNPKDRDQIRPRYLYHVLLNLHLENYVKGNQPFLSTSDFGSTKIPVPPIEIQDKIIIILDKLNGIVDIAQKEIDENQKKIDYYKRKMLSTKCDMCMIKDLATCQKKKNKDQKFNNAYSITQRGLIPTTEYFGEKTKITSSNTSNYYIVEKNWFVYSPSRIDVGSIGYHKSNETAIVSPIDVVFSVNSKKIDNDYLLSFLLSSEGMSQILFQRQGIEGTGRKNLPFDNFAKIEIPLPSINIQKQIVNKMKKFEKYINDILIPKRDLYQKRYEYYRNKLLNFEEIANE